ncbi:MAG: sensor histidine kinase KdpD [Polyangiaceae bacterium]|nr:sensor histidine kinase KdpD [Polyangiaceae bacterium]
MTERDDRPDPDKLLARVSAEEARHRRAKLKVYLGYAPGVGKTFTMLENAREMLASDKEVVVGLVETHGRYDTASLVLGLPLLPRRAIEYKGKIVEEFDLEAALERRPAVVLVDELAHHNAPGSRHDKRWRDVMDLLDAGIDVHTTLNVQHIESLNDVIEQITTVRVRETVPDAVLERADEIELVDIPPEELVKRLKDGKVYVPEQAATAIDHFFRRGNLLALRELALRKAADRVDLDVRAYREEHSIDIPWPAGERILVCVGPSPASARLVRATRRMAAGLRAAWVAVYVEDLRVPLDAKAKERTDAHLRLAESLGAEVVRLSGVGVGEALLTYARRHNVTRIVLGKPTHARILDRLRSSVLDDVVRGSGPIDVHVISGDRLDESTQAPPPPRRLEPRGGFLWAIGLVSAVTLVAHLARSFVAEPDVAMMYLLTVVLVATRVGRGASILSAALSVAAYDFFFVPPHFTFAINEARHLLTFAMMFGAGLLLSSLTIRIRQQERGAREREQRTAALFTLSRELGGVTDAVGVATTLSKQVSELLGCGAATVLPDDAGILHVAAVAGSVPKGIENDGVTQWVMEHGQVAGLGTGTLPGTTFTCVPLGSSPAVLGVLVVVPPDGRPLPTEERHSVMAFARQCAVALSRARLAEEAKTSALRARTEELRSSLLSTVSHDLRTPLATITGAATTLRDKTVQLSEDQRSDLLESITDEADRLERLVRNLLEMTRIESGGIEVKREWLPLEEVIGAALTRLESKLASRKVQVILPPDLPLVSVDPLLMEQVFVNLLDNAEKHTPPNSPIEIRAMEGDGDVTVEVLDRGPGLPRGTESKVFEKFFRGPSREAFGAGLGLAICKGVADAHGGSIVAENREDGGAVFRIRLPFSGPPPLVPSSRSVLDSTPEAAPESQSTQNASDDSKVEPSQ